MNDAMTTHMFGDTPRDRDTARLVEAADALMDQATHVFVGSLTPADIHGAAKNLGPVCKAYSQARAALSTHAAAPAQEVKVKALVWEDFDGWGSKANAMLLTSYMINRWSDGKFEVSVSAPGYGTGFDGERFHRTMAEAKAAAQADYSARILSALDLT